MVTIGQASLNEYGKTTGGLPGNQSGSEINNRNYYLHKKGWRAFRARNVASRNGIMLACVAAIQNKNIGYDQAKRDTLWNLARYVGYNPLLVQVPCSTDCSALVRVCCAYAGIPLQNFNTSSEPSVLLGSGQFFEVTDFNPSTGSGLAVGDILVTKTKGHTAIVLSADSSTTNAVTYYDVNGTRVRTLKKGDKGDTVKLLQRLLIANGYTSVGKVDGDFGSKTEAAVIAYQQSKNLVADGIVGKKTWGKLLTSNT